MRCNFPIVYGLKTTFADGITLARSNKQYGPKLGIFNLYQFVYIEHDWPFFLCPQEDFYIKNIGVLVVPFSS